MVKFCDNPKCFFHVDVPEGLTVFNYDHDIDGGFFVRKIEVRQKRIITKSRREIKLCEICATVLKVIA